MDLITFDAVTSRKYITTDPVIRFNRCGIITINVRACQIIGIKGGDQVVFHQDRNKKKDWYVQKVQEKGLLLRRNCNSGAQSLNICSAYLCKEVLMSLNKEKPVCIPISTLPSAENMFALLTSLIK